MLLQIVHEQQIPRPEDKRKRKAYYWGKKKRHTIKNQLTVNNRSYIIYKVAYKKGRKHDYAIYKKNHHIVNPKQVVNVVESRISWCRKELPRATIGTTI